MTAESLARPLGLPRPRTPSAPVRDVLLRPGDLCFAGEGTVMRTLLGSCVSITLWHPRLHVGGMCHYVVPSRRRSAAARLPVDQLDGRYADEAVQLFLGALRARGTSPEEYHVKMFGGGSQFEGTSGQGAVDVPTDNVDAGLRLLRENGFVLGAQHLRGTGHRQLVFDLASGDVWLKHVERQDVAS